MRIFIGYDQREPVAYHVLAHSILSRSSIPVSIAPLKRDCLAGVFGRPRGEYDSTDFAISRFLVPYLCDYQGWALFMDSDMLCRCDMAEIANLCTLRGVWESAVRVVQHDYTPSAGAKFLDQPQTTYSKKNWSSLMLFNNQRCRELTLNYVNSAPGLALHRFEWLRPHEIGAIPREYNYLVSEDNQCAPAQAKIIHFTNGGPWFDEYAHCEFANDWYAERYAAFGSVQAPRYATASARTEAGAISIVPATH